MTTINEVLAQLQQIIAECQQRQSPLGYFAALYHNMTAAVQAGILNGQFEDGARMERLDVTFAQRYLDAYQAHNQGQPTTRAWQVAFEAAHNQELTVLQHLLLGINAHINLDLGIAAAETSPGAAIWGLETDFGTINGIIAHLTETVQDRLGDICPPFALFDRIFKTQDEGIADFSIVVARKTAWNTAILLAPLQGVPRQNVIADIDGGVAEFAQRLLVPKSWVLRSAMGAVRWAEVGSVSEKIGVLMR